MRKFILNFFFKTKTFENEEKWKTSSTKAGAKTEARSGNERKAVCKNKNKKVFTCSLGKREHEDFL